MNIIPVTTTPPGGTVNPTVPKITPVVVVEGKESPVNISTATPPGPRGRPGTPGPPGTQVYSGVGQPLESLGVEGDYYIDEINNLMYGPKADVWGPASIDLGVILTNTDGDPGKTIFVGNTAPEAVGADGSIWIKPL